MSELIGIEAPDSPTRLVPGAPEGHLSLCGRWAFRLDPHDNGEKQGWHRPEAGADDWSEIVVPGVWQAQGYGLNYHGVGWYRRPLPAPAEWTGRHVWIQFHGVATKATVWLNGVRVGEHLGNWAPFTLSLADAWKASGENMLVVRVEELPAHFSAGFAREMGRIAGGDSHFGGLWQDVTLFATGDAHLSDLFVKPRLVEKSARIRLEVRARTSTAARVVVSVTDPAGNLVSRREEAVSPAVPQPETWSGPREVDLTLDVPNPRVWSPQSPVLYTATAEVHAGDRLSDRRVMRFGMRSVECKGTQVLLNGEPLMVRGVLHWGYYPDLLNIDPSEDQIRREFRDLRASGFNLVKVCLFVFPRRFYEIADETGMLLWQEYPTWLHASFPQAGDTRLDADFAREYPEWFRFDRSRTSIILRDLTCEAHNNPSFDLLERTYRTGKEMLDGAPLCDNSSFFIHRITDWYVCHTYRDLDDYYQYFPALVGEMRAKPEKKPFLFGEDFDADTWRDSEAMRERLMRDGTPWWLKNANFDGQLRFDEELRRTLGPGAPKRLVAMQKRHAFALRKAYVEEFRRYPEPAGFVMTSLRDTPGTRPGFYDDMLESKWDPGEWAAFNADRVLVLHCERRSRCFRADEPIRANLIFSNYGDDMSTAPVRWRLTHGNQIIAEGAREVSARRGEIQTVVSTGANLPDGLAVTSSPLVCRLEAWLESESATSRNAWTIWIFPSDDKAGIAAEVSLLAYSTTKGDDFLAGHPGLGLRRIEPAGNGEWREADTSRSIGHLQRKGTVLVTDTLDAHVRAAAKEGASVVFLPQPDNGGAFKRCDQPFWRETAIWLPEGPVMGDFPNEGFVDLQFLDMTQRKPFNLGDRGAAIRPLVWGVSARHPGLGAFDYVFEERMGDGRIVACCLQLGGKDNIAGRHFLRCLARYAAKGRANAGDAPGDGASTTSRK